MEHKFSDADIRHMNAAIKLAQKGVGLNHPNPLVGAVVAKGEHILGTGYHLYSRVIHAEPSAIAKAGNRSRGASLYINLEPCSHTGRTPPCTEAIIQAGIKKVFFSVHDTDPRVCGRGEAILRNAGILVEYGLLKEKATELNRDYLKAKATGLPWIVVKVAMSLDGKIGLAAKHGEYFSCDESLKLVHELRAWCDAIMVGANTVRIDNPQLTCRIDSFSQTKERMTEEKIFPKPAGKRNPLRITVSRAIDIPLNSKIFDTSDAESMVITSLKSDKQKISKLESKGVEVITAREENDEIDLLPVFQELVKKGIYSVLVEGGGELIGWLVAKGLVDELYLSIAPILIGGTDSPSWLNRNLSDSISKAPRMKEIKAMKTGTDLLVRIRLNTQDWESMCRTARN